MIFKDFVLTFPADVADYVRTVYGESETIVEYGSGGSTFLAAEAGKLIVTVESSEAWMVQLMSAVQERALPGRVVPLWADVGPTGKWGFPVGTERAKNWSEYPLLPWRFCAEHDLSPDVVLIDGRFRAACFIAAATSITKPTRILFDDYLKRPHYHFVSRVCEPSRMIGRMAVFDLEPGQVDSRWLLGHVRSFADPR